MFLALTLVGLAILSAVVLFPAYCSLAETEYRLGSLRSELAETQDLLTVNQRLIRDLPSDEVLIRRLARAQTEWVPPNEVVVIGPVKSEPTAAHLVSIPPRPRPRPPNRWMLLFGAMLRRGVVRKGLVLVAAGGMMAGLLLPAPGRPRRATR